jgi:hypothetical protein
MIKSVDDHERGTTVTRPDRQTVNDQGVPIGSEIGGRPAGEEGMIISQGRPKERRAPLNTRAVLLALLSTTPSAVMAQCLSLQGSTACSAFQSSSVSTTDSHVVGLLYVKLDIPRHGGWLY